MQLQPFKRPDYSTIQQTRDQIAALRPAIADAYTSGDSMSQTVTTGGPATGPQVGDLHPWDALVDGCLYYDEATLAGDSFYGMVCNGHSGWINDETDGDIDKVLNGHYGCPRTCLRAANSHRALVLAVGLKTADDFRAAVVAHRLSVAQDGGAE